VRWRRVLVPSALLSFGWFIAITQAAPTVQPAACIASGAGGGALTVQQLEALWIQGGGPAAVAPTAGAIAMAESGGKSVIQQGQPYATTGWGYWQITPGNSEPQFGVDQQLLVPINNARAAVAKYTAAGGFTPWTTYTSGAYLAHLPSSGAPASAGLVNPCASFTVLSSGGVVFPFPQGASGVAPVSAWTQDQGVDISAPGGTPELAIAAGTIVTEGISGFGPNAPILQLDTPINVGGTLIAFVYYGHAGPDLVPVGVHVQAGQQITTVGNGIVGISSGPHLEFGGNSSQAIPARGATSGAVMTLLKTACGTRCP
jgi:murein DD-endopeptidase MepM/ murein hydrolase activator NlpD